MFFRYRIRNEASVTKLAQEKFELRKHAAINMAVGAVAVGATLLLPDVELVHDHINDFANHVATIGAAVEMGVGALDHYRAKLIGDELTIRKHHLRDM